MSERNLEALKIKKRYEERLLSLKGVTGIGVNGSVIIYVEKMTPQLRQFIPKTLDGIPVKVIETGVFRPLAFPIVDARYLGRTDRIRPAPGGCSVGHPDITAGTLTSRFIKDGKILGLSNCHVLNGEWGTSPGGNVGDPILQPGAYDGGTLNDKLGELEDWIPVKLDAPNLVDAAIFRSEELSEEVLEVGKPAQTIEPEVGMNVKKSGRTSGLTFSQLIDVNASVNVSGNGVALFTDQCIAPVFGYPGDSGSWVGNENDETVAILFAGSSTHNVLCKALNVEKLLGGEIIPPLPHIPALTAAGWIPVFALGSVMSTKERR